MYMLLIDGTLQQGKNNEFLDAWSKHILTLLKKQDGFVDEILLFEQGKGPGCVGLSLWNTQEQCERYYREVFPQAKNNGKRSGMQYERERLAIPISNRLRKKLRKQQKSATIARGAFRLCLWRRAGRYGT